MNLDLDDLEDFDDLEEFDEDESRRRRPKANKMPVGSQAKAKARAKQTYHSDRARKRVDRERSGIRNRGRKKGLP